MAKSPAYQPRHYREAMGNSRWHSFRSALRETDLWVAVDAGSYTGSLVSFTMSRTIYYRDILEKHINEYPEFRDSLVPVVSPAGVHPLIAAMYAASQAADTGPMSAVAGALAEFIAFDLIRQFNLQEVIIENGGDIFMKLTSPAKITVYAGSSPLSEKVALLIKAEETPLAVCCSSGTIGHSLSFGTADACMIASRSGAAADAWATAFCNMVKNSDMVQEVTEKALSKPDIDSVVIIAGESVGLGGSMDITFI